MKRVALTLGAIAIIFTACGTRNFNGIKNQAGINSLASTADPKTTEKLTKDQFIQKIWDYSKTPNEWRYLGNKPAIIDFYADWCGPCKIASPILDQIGVEFAGKILIYKVNTDEERELAQVFGITGIPAFLYIPAKGKPTMMSGIGQSKEETKKMFVENIEKYLLVKK